MIVTIGGTMLAIGFAAVILLAAEQGTTLNKLFSNRVLKLVGKYSYGIYVYHPLVIGVLGSFVLDHFISGPMALAKSLLGVGMMALLTVLISALSYELFERRILSYKRYFEYESTNHRQQVEKAVGQA